MTVVGGGETTRAVRRSGRAARVGVVVVLLVLAGCVVVLHPEPALVIQDATAARCGLPPGVEACDDECNFTSSLGCPVGPAAPSQRRKVS